jgi:AcrR family transcriptional regulator
MTPSPQHRGPAVESSVLESTLALLAERGAALTVDDVAAASGVHKTTIYRRWATREQLIAAAVTSLAERAVPPTTDDDPRVAIERLALAVAETTHSNAGPNILRATIAASAASSELVQLADDFFRTRYALAVEHLTRLAQAGGLRADIDPVVVWEQIVNPMHVRALCGRPTSDADARLLVELALRGAAP